MPIEIDAALNERDYGELNGKDKYEAIATFGKEKVGMECSEASSLPFVCWLRT